MNKTVYVDVTSGQIKDLVERVQEEQAGDKLLLLPVVNLAAHSPTKKGRNKNYHRIQVEVLIPKDVIIGESVLQEIGVLMIGSIPESRLSPEYLIDKTKIEGGNTNE